ncbi:MAG: single-stranded DNA-binding protein [Phycisphaerales bacterium]|nr:single-stranded DNA-binding protein [Phycisphaerales bacterium]
MTELATIGRWLAREVDRLQFGRPVTHVYDPLVYARAAHEQYVERYGRGTREIVLLGMNPGPWGMAQTGVPFGEVGTVRDWLGMTAPIGRPASEHPKRPVMGYECRRSEVSGARLWGWARAMYGTPTRFFERFFVANYCPLCFMEASGRNRTPNQLPVNERSPLLALCDEALRRTVAVLRPRLVVGVGAFAESRARAALGGVDVAIVGMLHPSPASPAANRDWAGQAMKQLRVAGIDVP